MKAQPRAERFVSRHRFALLFGAIVAFYVLMPVLHELREGLPPVVPTVVEGVLFMT